MLMKQQSTTHVMMDSIVHEEPSSSTACGGSGGDSRAIDRHNPIIRDEKRLGQGRIFASQSTTAATTNQPHLWNQNPEVEASGDQKRKSVAFAYNDDEFLNASDFISPTSSSRCLLNNITTSEFHHAMPPLPPPPPSSPPREHHNINNGNAFKKKDHDLLSSPPPTPQLSSPPSPPHPPPSSNQVVVLEVALHCKGCERKMKKHISKIEGVTSFNIEFAAKKVTVVGDVTPLAVLTSVLKVKNAKLLTPAIISSSSPPPAQTGSNGSR